MVNRRSFEAFSAAAWGRLDRCVFRRRRSSLPPLATRREGGTIHFFRAKARSKAGMGYRPLGGAILLATMALSKLSGDEQGIILGQLRNTLEPRLVMYFSSANKELRALLPPAVRQQLRTDYEVATALCLKVGMSCKELREATQIRWRDKGLTSADLATLATLGSLLPALEWLILTEPSGSAGPDVLQLAEGLVAGALPAVTLLIISGMHVGDAGAAELAAALDRGALPRLEILTLNNAAIGDAALAALASALRRRPALESLDLGYNPLGDEGLAALMAPPPPAGTPPPPAGGLKKLKLLDLGRTQITDAGCATLAAASHFELLHLERLHLSFTQVTDAGCATLAAALESGALPALKELKLIATPASVAARDAVSKALVKRK